MVLSYLTTRQSIMHRLCGNLAFLCRICRTVRADPDRSQSTGPGTDPEPAGADRSGASRSRSDSRQQSSSAPPPSAGRIGAAAPPPSPWWQRQDRQPASPDGRERQVLPSPTADRIRSDRGGGGRDPKPGGRIVPGTPRICYRSYFCLWLPDTVILGTI